MPFIHFQLLNYIPSDFHQVVIILELAERLLERLQNQWTLPQEVHPLLNEALVKLPCILLVVVPCDRQEISILAGNDRRSTRGIILQCQLTEATALLQVER